MELVKQEKDISPELEIVNRCREGDRSSFRELYDLYKDRVYSTSFRLLGNAEDAEDASQETFIKIHGSIKSFRGDSSLLTWIYRDSNTGKLRKF